MKKFRIVFRWATCRIRVRVRRHIRRTPGRRLYLTHKETARTLVMERILHFNKHYNVTLGRIAIRNQKSRWGSCSKKGNLNFNYKLVFLTPELRDYVIVHEICHIKEFNHGAGFWNLVAQTMPDHKMMNKKLRKIQLNISRTPSLVLAPSLDTESDLQS